MQCALVQCAYSISPIGIILNKAVFLTLSAYFPCSGDLKVVLNEGMPRYRKLNPYDKGRLVIKFDDGKKEETRNDHKMPKIDGRSFLFYM